MVIEKYIIYGDPAYPISDLILNSYCSGTLAPEQVTFNKCKAMCLVRQAVEWRFGKVITEFAFIDSTRSKQHVHDRRNFSQQSHMFV